MIIKSGAPCRISLLGGGTDVGEYQKEYGGICINLAINIRQEIEINDTDFMIRMLKGDSKLFFDSFLPFPNNFGVKHTFAGKIESGLGSSAALAVSLIGAFRKYNNKILNLQEIAEEAWDIEVNRLRLFGGKQDQYAAVYGGASLLIFEDKVYRYALPKEAINKISPYLVLFDSGIRRASPKIQEGLRQIKISQRIALDKIKDLAYLGLDAIIAGDATELGYILDEAWEQKKISNGGVSTHELGILYEKAKKNGALGGKVCGAGGGGCMVFITQDPEKLITGMPIKHIPFEIDWDGLKVEEIKERS